MDTVYLILPTGKGHYGELTEKYEKMTYIFKHKNVEIEFINEANMLELAQHIENLLSEVDIIIEDKLWLIKGYLNNIRIRKYEN